ncbi:hypothetical protein E1211_26340 [Micromonospora sp. 15K316]|uniref:hypothetical protein n=1 Tax=Micromonospora sp. 15K316 TaxID=2530376 RepID=UPI001048EC25|nr:hypothetical protein [Micromonospora sp. 15K316]TDC29256.1 hypothetical protein E1211_26340 [Micromonospora sp. 15K316]
MAVMWPLGPQVLKRGLLPRRPVGRRVALRKGLLGLAALALVIAAGLLGAQLGRLAAPTVVRWQVERIDSGNEAPSLPPLPPSPFGR